MIGIIGTGNTDMAGTSVGRIPGVAVQATIVSYILTGRDWIPPLTPALASVVLTTLILIGRGASFLRPERSRIVNVLSQYFARPVLKRLIETGHSLPAASERLELAILFPDIRSFTAWTGRAGPDEAASRLNDCFSAMTPLVEKHGGTLDKFIGDCIMVFFGAPAIDNGHALHARPGGPRHAARVGAAE